MTWHTFLLALALIAIPVALLAATALVVLVISAHLNPSCLSVTVTLSAICHTYKVCGSGGSQMWRTLGRGLAEGWQTWQMVV